MKRAAPLLPWLARAAACVLAAGLLVRATRVRDSLPPFGIVFYATPWPVLAAISLTLAAYALSRGRRTRGLVLALIFAGSATMWVRHGCFFRQPSALGEHAMRVAYWNANRPATSDQRTRRVAYLQSLHADLIAVGESSVYTDDIPAEWRGGFPNRTLTQRSGFLLITPEPPVSIEKGRLADHGDYLLARCMVKARAVSVLLVDLESRPTQSRAPCFARLDEIFAAHRDEPLIVMGDFNTPRESAHFDPWRRDFTHAFESAGRGFAETWPAPLPVLSLDHLWLGARWRALHCELGWSRESDHRAILADISAQ